MSSRALITIRINDLPEYLRSSAFAEAIDGEDDVIEVPANCNKRSLTIRDDGDLSLLLSTLRFWGVDTIPREVVLYIIWKKPEEVLRATTEYSELQYLSFLQALCDSTHRSCGKHSLVYWGHSSNLAWSTNPDEAAAQVCLVHYEYSNGDIWTAQTTAVAARNGQLGALKFLHQHGCLWDVTTCTEAANWGHLACLQYAHENGCKWNAETCTKAAQSGRLGTLKYVVDKGCEVNVQTLVAAMPHPLCIQLLRDMGFWKLYPLLTAAAASTRDLPLLRQLHEQGCPWDKRTCEAAARGGDLACLQYAHEQGCPWDSDTCGDAANNGKVECLRYAIDHGCPRPAELIIKAAQSSSCMQYLHEIGVSWAQGVTWRAALCLDTKALAYAHEHGCPWDADTANTAASWAKESCLKYALEHNCPTQYDTCNIAAASDLKCLKLVLKHGCVWGTATSAAAAKAGSWSA
jgi:hypothetical protein